MGGGKIYMLDHLKDFLLNIFFILSPLVLYPYIYKMKKNVRVFRLLIGFLCSFVLIVIMSLPVNINGIIYDFRSVPIIVGSLYGGPIVSVVLYGILVSYRFIIGNPNNLIYIFSILPSLILIIYTWRSYETLKIYQKIIVAILLCTLMKLTTFTFYFTLIHNLDLLLNNLVNTFQTYFVQGVIVGICVYLIELLNNYFYMQEEIYKSERVKLVSDMAASVAHEIRNPLTTVRGFIQLIGEGYLDKEKQEQYKKICLEELNRADQIITDYLSLAKPTIETFESISIDEEMKYFTNVLLTYANYNNVQIKCNYSVDKDLSIYGDRNKFRQALINIGKNGIESMDDGGILEIGVHDKPKNIIIEISDNGCGMTPDQLKRLGTPFYSTKDKGTGLGTMVSFSIIKNINGKINVKSQVGKGTEYRLEFPKQFTDEGEALS